MTRSIAPRPTHTPAHKHWRYVDALWIPLAALLAVLPLLVHGTSCGHDLSFHLENWMEVATQWRHGVLRPWWAFHAAFHAGEPRFVFYPPLSWVLGALLGTVLPWAATPIAYTYVTLVLCGLAMRRLLRAFVSPTVAIAGACLYLANPYMLFVAYERTAYAELLAAAWMPLLLLAALRLKLKPLHLAAAVALLWLTNAPAAVVGCYSLLCLGAVRLVFAARLQGAATAMRQAWALTWATLLGLAAVAFYLVPAVVQRRLVQIDMAVLPGMRPTDSFLFQHTADPGHDAVLRSASWIAVGTLAVAIACIAALLLRQRTHRAYSSMRSRQAAAHHPAAERTFPLAALAMLTAVIALLLLPWSTFVWHHAPELAFLQFPWRFLSMEAAVTVLLLCLAADGWNTAGSQDAANPRTRRSAAVLACVCAAVCAAAWGAHAAYAQTCDDEDAPRAQRALYLGGPGTPPTDEYTPTDADNDALHPGLPAAWLATSVDGAPNQATAADILTLFDGDPAHLQFRVPQGPPGRMLMVRLRQFTGWRVTLDGVSVTPEPQRADGLFSIAVPAQAVIVDVRYRWTADEIAGLLLSLGALLAAGLVRWPLRR